MNTNRVTYSGPGDSLADQPFFKWSQEHKFVVQREIDPDAPALLVNRLQSWLSDRGERCVAWRTPRGKSYQLILVSIKNPDTALLFKLTWGGAQ